jgi:hypothetical protein
MVNEPTGRNVGVAPSEMAQLAKLLMRLGADIDLIARTSGQYKETIRYRYKEKILGRGFALQARLNFQGLGMQRIVMKVKMGAAYASYTKELFMAMNKLCYVTSFSALMPEEFYLVHANVPKEFKDKFVEVMTKLRELGIFASIDFYSFDRFRNVPMRAEYYDFEHGLWEFDWGAPIEHPREGSEDGFEAFTFDKLDLLIMKELQADATRSLREICDAIRSNDGMDINYKTLAWHWTRHVQEKRMINGYALRWMGTRYDPVADAVKRKPHKYIFITTLVRRVNESERLALTAEMNKVPFIWSEAAGEDYYAQFAFPVETLNDAFSFLKTVMSRFGDRAEYHVIDQMNSLSFTLTYQLYDDVERRWTFNSEEALMRFQSLIMKIGESSGVGRNAG